MAKVWKDANEVINMIHELPNEKLRKIEREMISVPKFDKYDKKKQIEYVIILCNIINN